jgi:hypothetical protein
MHVGTTRLEPWFIAGIARIRESLTNADGAITDGDMVGLAEHLDDVCERAAELARNAWSWTDPE